MMAAFLVITASIAILTPMAQALRTSSADEVWVASIYSMAVAGLGMAAGPVVGGVLLLRFSWRSVFIVTIIIAVFVLVLVPFFIPDSRSPGRRLDPAGLVLGVLAIGALSYGVIRGGNEGHAATAIVVSFCVAALSVTTPS
jgi:MFS family permease